MPGAMEPWEFWSKWLIPFSVNSLVIRGSIYSERYRPADIEIFTLVEAGFRLSQRGKPATYWVLDAKYRGRHLVQECTLGMDPFTATEEAAYEYLLYRCGPATSGSDRWPDRWYRRKGAFLDYQDRVDPKSAEARAVTMFHFGIIQGHLAAMARVERSTKLQVAKMEMMRRLDGYLAPQMGRP